MGASPLMSLGLRAMAASYAAMETTGHNIANSGVAGYSRQTAELSTAKGQFTGAGFFGKGVDVTTVSRSHDKFLTRAAATARSQSSMDAARQQRLTQLEDVFPTGESGLGNTVGSFLNAMVDLSSHPGDNATRQVVLARAEDMATRFNSAAQQFDTIQAGVTEDLKTSVATVNGLADSIARVNNQIAAARGLGQPPNDMLDERDRLISELSEHLQVSTVEADDGTMAVFIAGGQRLVLGAIPSKLQVTLDPLDPSRSALALAENGLTRVIDGASLGGGGISGLLRFQNDDLVDARNMVGQMAAAVGMAINEQQMLGLNMQVPAGTVPSTALFAIGQPLSLPASSNARDAAGNYIGSVAVTIVDASALQAADYELRADPGGVAGVYQLTRMSDPPLVRSVVSGDVVDGVRIDIGAPAPAATDRFLLQPVGRAASGMARLLADPRDLAAASPLVGNVGNDNIGTASVASLSMLTRPPSPAATATITFTSDGGDYTWELADDTGLLRSGVGVWQPNTPIPTPPDDINGFGLNLAGVPRSGDVLTVEPTQPQYVSSNNGNALAMASLRDAGLVGRVQLNDGSMTGGITVTDAYATAMANIGVRVQTAESAATISSAVSTQAEGARSETSGVNLDEEAARLIQFQQSYQAAAKVLQVAQSLFQTLLETAGG